MECVPKMLTSKDLSYMEDMLNWNFNTIKKINHYVTEISDEEISNELERVGEIYNKHYNILLDILGGFNESE